MVLINFDLCARIFMVNKMYHLLTRIEHSYAYHYGRTAGAARAVKN